jgi:hypothetical protein
MGSRVSTGRVTIVVLGLGFLAQAAVPFPAVAQGPPVFSVRQLTKQQFEALPDTALVESRGQRMTKAQILAKAARSQEAMAKAQTAARQAQARAQARLAQFNQQQHVRLQADNAKVQAELARLRQARATPQARQLEAIEQEAAQLWQQAQRASPAERAQIEQRAAQLLQQLQQVGR